MLKDKINEDFKAAFKEKKEGELSVLKNLKAALLNKEKEKQFQASKAGEDIAQAVLADDDIIAVISAEVKKLRDAIALFEQGGRADLVAQNKGEIEVLLRYLPAQLSEDEIKKLVADTVAQAGAATVKDMGKVMGILMPKIKGRADSGLAGRLVKEALGWSRKGEWLFAPANAKIQNKTGYALFFDLSGGVCFFWRWFVKMK